MGDWRVVELEPLDVVSVRDGKPFDVGDAVRARSLFPPTPWSVLGALRTLLIERLGVDPALYGNRSDESKARLEAIAKVREVVGDPDGAPGFELGPVLLACAGKDGDALLVFGDEKGAKGQVAFPAPMDLGFVREGDRGARLVRLERRAAPEGYVSSVRAGSELLFAPGGDRIDDDFAGFRLTSKGMGGTLQAAIEGRPRQPPIVAEDNRTGIALEGKTVRQGYFYTRQTMAMAPGWSLRVAVRATNDVARKAVSELRGLVRLGSDGHAARVGQGGEWGWPGAAGDVDGRAALYFASPVALEDATAERLSKLAGGEVSVVARATMRPLSLGGWKLGVGPRDMRRYWPAGTVLHLASRGADLARLHGASVASDELERCAGFGFGLLGKLEG